MAAEYSTQVETANPQESYLTTDHLGSPRVITDKSGTVTSRRDFMPFGEELSAGIGTRSTTLSYAASGTDNIRKRFTGYEKDQETQLDFAEARMYQNKHGRFTAVDPLMASASPGDPQTFNRYSYTGNNPINRTDPSGLDYYANKKTDAIQWFDENPGDEWDNITGRETPIGKSGCVVGGCVDKGDIVIFNANKSITFKHRGNYQTEAEKVAGEVTAKQNEVITTSATDTAVSKSTVSPRPLEGLPPCPILLCPLGSTPSPTAPSLDLSKNGELNTVKAIKAAYNLCSLFPGIGMACGAAAAIVDIGQGNFGEAGVSLAAGVIPGLKIGRNAGKLFKAADEVIEDSYVVYQGINPATKAVEYVGITMRDVGIRQAEHWLDPTKAHLAFEQVKGASNLTKMQARVWEQTLINKYRMGKNGGPLLNKINSIAEKYWAQYGITR